MHRFEHIQSKLWDFVHGGCLFFSILAAYEDKTKTETDFIDIFVKSVSKRWVSLDGNVNNSLAILEYIDGKKWARKIVGDLLEIPKGKDGFIIEKWESREGGTHFKPQGYDVFLNSRTVCTGQLLCYYFYYHE